jgi:hypothetical protein
MEVIKYKIFYGDIMLALVYISNHPMLSDKLLATIIPLEKKGKWEDQHLEIHVENPIHDIFDKSIDHIAIVKELLALARIEPYKCKIYPSTPN